MYENVSLGMDAFASTAPPPSLGLSTPSAPRRLGRLDVLRPYAWASKLLFYLYSFMGIIPDAVKRIVSGVFVKIISWCVLPVSQYFHG
jgi:hypothetical protein